MHYLQNISLKVGHNKPSFSYQLEFDIIIKGAFILPSAAVGRDTIFIPRYNIVSYAKLRELKQSQIFPPPKWKHEHTFIVLNNGTIGQSLINMIKWVSLITLLS